MSTTKTATSYKLSLGVENGVNALGAAQVKSVSVGSVKLDAAATASSCGCERS